jgi:hypothetical protein
MNSDQRKEYNKKYYAEKKATILNKLATKVECPLCKRQVAHQNLKSHQAKNICKGRRAESSEIKRLEEQIKKLSCLIESNIDMSKMTPRDLPKK